MPPAVEAQSLNHWTAREVHCLSVCVLVIRSVRGKHTSEIFNPGYKAKLNRREG